MKKLIAFVLVVATLLSFVGCNNAQKIPEPQISQMRAICELATMECYYHNVAKYHETGIQTDWFGWFHGEKHFWIEYAGVVTVGIDAALVTIKVSGENVEVTIPPARVLGSSVDAATLTEDSFIIADGSLDIKAEDQTKTYTEAQYQMELAAAQDSTLLANAQERAKALLKNYIDNVGEALGVTYKITWVEVDETGTPTGIIEKDTTEENTGDEE